LIRYGLVLVSFLSLVACGSKAPPPPAPALTDLSCQISLVDVPSEMKVGGQPAKITVKVVNSSAASWPAQLGGRNLLGSVNIAYHWNLNEKNVVEGQRALLSSDLATKQGADVQLEVKPPPEEGNYVLRVEPVQEAVAWFSERGGCKVEARVKAVR
jgi:hypothetical protein